jgi:hypothetical protein
VLLTNRIAVFAEGPIKGVEHGKKVVDQQLDSAVAVGVAFLLDTFSIVFEIRLAPNQRVHQIIFLGLKFAYLLREQRRLATFISDRRTPADGIRTACFGSFWPDWASPAVERLLLIVATAGVFLFRV